ncbi:MAG: metal-dependent hydrolase [Bdellovibrionota bacterium]
MDNVTHSLIGLAAGEAWAVGRNKKQAPLWIASALANNIPDIDVPLGALISHDPLSRLLSHRGYSHTLISAPLQGLLIFFLIWFIYRKRADFSAVDILGISLLGPFLHILADSWNSYGVHPSWPFSNEWVYGDFVFILEPWIWAITLPALYFATSSKPLRAACGFIAAAILTAAWKNDLVPGLVAGALTLFLVGFTLLLKKISSARIRISLAFSAMALFLGIFSLTSRELQAKYSRSGFELAISPYPGNPFCWTAHLAGFSGEQYSAAVMRLAPYPRIFPVQKCEVFFSNNTSAPLTRVDQPFSSEQTTLGIFSAKRSELEMLSRECRGEAFLRFARIPYWKPVGNHWLMGDLRFDRGGGRNFATTEVPGAGCPDFKAPWIGRFSSGSLHKSE